jgi:hypothetical protein
MMLRRAFLIAVLALLLLHQHETCGWTPAESFMSRRQAIASAAFGVVALPQVGAIAEIPSALPYELRDRKGNKDAVIAQDYWYMVGQTPPRRLNGPPLRLDDPRWNTYGSCETTEGGSTSNSCTYVSLTQRIPTYSKYAFNIDLGAKEYRLLGQALKDAAATNNEKVWNTAASYVTTLPSTPPPPPVDALLKMVLFASGMLTSPSYNGPSRELLVARFYVNEVGFATKEIIKAIEARDGPRAVQAWEFGKDSWNSYYQIVNGKIAPKVGGKFELIE